ncbi:MULTISPECIES: glycosyltransferase family 2 protein [Kaistia]|uniref:Glycosyltransferase family 2 protein n=1 Tax=Kaistia nematophila TaxID=2994654 RepID=A0A9X3DZG7_9HYPH|nr:glycosyltransferase family 2 protein [Kaistia nematophila]MBN9024932.1 glycosyltransferase family 2 protein [Hyphomicrobiales bacterium]MBN9059164.1 glycosyltransferase family 2 protein [Hyphomicrobiales bacterium]MCX5568617.1 glycosyltransferase family 2 protein [Kaistia nematophila]
MTMPAPGDTVLTSNDATARPLSRPEVSVVIPCKNEAENLPELIGEIAAALAGRNFEIIVVDDGSTDATPAVIRDLMRDRPWLRSMRDTRSSGQSAAVRTGLLAARGDVVLTIDGDGQNNPEFMPAMLDALEQGGPRTALVAGQRLKRTDSGAKRMASRFANRLRGSILKDGTRDSGCGLKAVRREVFLLFPYFDGWHRYLPALTIREGYKVAHVDVVDRNRRHGTSKYGILDRALVGALDLFGVWWLIRRRKNLPAPTEVKIDGR